VAQGSTAGLPGEPPGVLRQRPADGIFGTIITASVLASAGDDLDTLPLAISILVTLAVYWIADVYSELLGRQLDHGHLPSWHRTRATLAATWAMVSASFVPLLLLALARLAGASATTAATVGLVGAIVMLTIYAWAAAHAARLQGLRLVLVTSVAALLGVVMVVLKNFVLVHLH
jgi:hypothetical protein